MDDQVFQRWDFTTMEIRLYQGEADLHRT